MNHAVKISQLLVSLMKRSFNLWCLY